MLKAQRGHKIVKCDEVNNNNENDIVQDTDQRTLRRSTRATSQPVRYQWMQYKPKFILREM